MFLPSTLGRRVETAEGGMDLEVGNSTCAGGAGGVCGVCDECETLREAEGVGSRDGAREEAYDLFLSDREVE